jgi:hypothetical protein
MRLDRELWIKRIRTAGVPAALLLGIYFFLTEVHAHYPIQKWLFWRYAHCWALSAVFAAACLSSGHAAIIRVLRRPLPLIEHAVTSFAAGVYLFFLGMVAGGLLGLYRAPFFVAWPLLLFAAGARPSYRYVKRLVRHVRFRRKSAPPSPWWITPVTALGLLGVLLVYFVILTPDNISFDSRWMHLGIAEHYVAAGAVRPFVEGWYSGAVPHLASFLYTWAFLLPWGTLFDRVELAAHIEFTVFLVTLAGIPALVRLLVPGTRGRGTWAVRFVFPGIFLYDSSLSGGADHIAAVFAVPIFTLVLRAYRELSPRLCVLLALMLSGVMLAKLSAAFLLLPFPALAIAVRSVSLGVATLRKRVDPAMRGAWIKGPAVILGAGLAFTAPHWLKNLVFYRNPVYPVLSRVFPSRPWSEAAAYHYQWVFEAGLWRPEKNWEGLKASLKALVTFSFVPNDWPAFHGAVPVFGSLFTLMLLAMPFLRASKRLWGLFAAVHMGVFAWFWTHHQDRYLQTMLPWMAAATAAAFILVWRSGVFARAGLAALAALQVIWGGDVYFIPTHAMIRSPIKDVVDLLARGYKKEFSARDNVYAPFDQIGRALPERSKVVVHEFAVHVGINAMSVSDRVGWQAGIDYGAMDSPRAIHDLLSSYGVTHLLWETGLSKGGDSIAGDLMFFNFALNHAAPGKTHGHLTLAPMPAAPPAGEFNDLVASLTCKGYYAAGLYPMKNMRVPSFGPRRTSFPKPTKAAATPPGVENAAALVKEAAFAVVDPRCGWMMPPEDRGTFRLAARRKELELWVRSRGSQTPAPAEAQPPHRTPGEP